MNDLGTTSTTLLDTITPPALKTSPEKLKYRKDLYDARKALKLCVECAVRLPRGHRTNRCEDCQDRRRLSEIAYANAPGRRKGQREQKARERETRIKANVCTRCTTPRAEWEPPAANQLDRPHSPTCPPCRAYLLDAQAVYKKRKAAGLVLTKHERRSLRATKRRAALAVLHGTGYEPIDTPAVPRDRILLALARLDWPTPGELLEALELPDFVEGDTNRLRNAHTSALSRLVRKSKLVERRRLRIGKVSTVEVQLTEAGRACVAAMKGTA